MPLRSVRCISRSGRLPALVVVLVSLVVIDLAPSVATASGRRPSTSTVTADGLVAPGITLTTLRLPGPQVVRVLRVRPSDGYEIVAAPATGRLGGRSTTTAIARRWNAIAAINGDYFNLVSGIPNHAFASRGRLLHFPGLKEALAAVGGTRSSVGDAGPPLPLVNMVLPGAVISVARVNDGPLSGSRTSLRTREAGGFVDTTGSCGVVLAPSGSPHPLPAGDVVQPYAVVAVRCDAGRIPVGRNDVWSVPRATPGATLRPGTAVTLSWRLREDWPGRTDAVGALCEFVVGGAISTNVINRAEPYFHRRAARTALGWTADGRILLVTIDQKKGGARGMTPHEAAELLQSLGAHMAVNLDGGGSTAMAVRGALVSQPSGAERAVSTAVLVVPSGTPTPE